MINRKDTEGTEVFNAVWHNEFLSLRVIAPPFLFNFNALIL